MWVKLYCEQEAIVEVDLPLDADKRTITQAALAKLDESGGAEWETILGEVVQSSDERLLYRSEEMEVHGRWL